MVSHDGVSQQTRGKGWCVMTPWENPLSYEAEPEPRHFDGVRQLSGVVIAVMLLLFAIGWGIYKVAHS